ncbi:MAG: hypothetical protein WCK35_16110 [Chloroflexota bacterium]
MFGQLKKMWGYYIALLTVIAVLSYHIVWVYQVVLRRFGEDIALLALTATMIVVVILVIRGAVYASMLDGILRGQVMALKNPPNPGTTIQPFELKILGMVLFRYPDTSFEFQVDADADVNDEYQLDPNLPMDGKKLHRFTDEKIRSAIEKWDRRDKSFSARTLDDFLRQEFGSEPSGVPLMAQSTFYDHRRRIRKARKVGSATSQSQKTSNEPLSKQNNIPDIRMKNRS